MDSILTDLALRHANAMMRYYSALAQALRSGERSDITVADEAYDAMVAIAEELAATCRERAQQEE